MCLVMENKIDKAVAEKDITCYKVFFKQDGYKILTTPYRKTPMFLGKTYYTLEYPIYGTGCCAYMVGKHYIVEKGCFHSFKTIQGAKHFLKRQKYSFYLGNYVVVKCIIPKDSEYYEGMFYVSDSNYKCYASRYIKPLEIVM